MSFFSELIKTQRKALAKAKPAKIAKNKNAGGQKLAKLAELALAKDNNKAIEEQELAGLALAKPENTKKDPGPSVATVATVAVADHENEIPAHVWVALDAGGIQPDELPDWSPGSCQSLLLDVKELYPDRFTFRGGLGYHGVNCPEEWPPGFSMAIQSVYIQAMQCSEKDWRVFLARFDGVDIEEAPEAGS